MTTDGPAPERARIWIIDLTWIVAPLGFFFLFNWAFGKWAPDTGDADFDLLAFEAALAALIAGFTLIARQQALAGWRKPKGFSWLWISAPLWLGVLTPLPMAAQNLSVGAERIMVWVAIALFVAVAEETLFRGFMLRGLMRRFSPMIAVIASSLAFGLLHFLNLAEGGHPLVIGAQMISATGVGAVFAAMTLRSGGVLPAMLLHFLGDAVGLAALGGYENAITSVELAPSIAVTGIVFLAWGLFWSWRAARAGKIAAR